MKNIMIYEWDDGKKNLIGVILVYCQYNTAGMV